MSCVLEIEGVERRNPRQILIVLAIALLAVVTLAFCHLPSYAANDNPEPDEPKGPRHYETWSGADAARHFWLTYSGVTLAPFGDMHADGWRIRFAGGYGQYRYESFNDDTLIAHEFVAKTSFAEGLVGYLWRLDPLILKAFVGVSAIEHTITPYDAANRAQGLEIGVKGVLELWYNFNPETWGSLDLAWSSAHNARSARARLGYRIWPEFSLGLEGGANVDIQGDYKINVEREAYASKELDYTRVGAFGRYEWDGGEISASGGLLGDFTEDRSAYATLNYLKQF